MTSQQDDSNKHPFDYAQFLRTLTSRPGVYQMLDKSGDIIYVGKAKNLKKRVASYFQKQDHSPKTRVMVSLIRDIQIIVTDSEHEALVLENQLIKKNRPRYNVVFRDDKSYPWIYLSNDEFPRLSIHRGLQRGKGEYFGPFTGSSAARYSINLMQKLFGIRPCENSVFKYRSRPCLQFQIKRCSGSCVGKINKQNYDRDVEMVRLFYKGKNDQVITALNQRMEEAAASLDFEAAAKYRDQIIALRRVLEKQVVAGSDADADVIVCGIRERVAAVFLLQIRHGMVQGNRTFFPSIPADTHEPELLESFLSHYYLAGGQTIPKELIIKTPLDNQQELQALLIEQRGARMSIRSQVKTHRAEWLQMAERNLEQLIASKLQAKAHVKTRMDELMKALSMDRLPMRMECFDISHFQGEATVASCVVFEQGQAKKSDYRRFNIQDVTPGDDYAAIEQAVRRRYSRLVKEEARLPDLLLIDGGKGQLNQAQKVVEELGLDSVTLIGVAKGVERKAGMEQIFFPDQALPIQLDADSPALHLIQAIRDESHRFAITGHRGRREKKRKTSTLESIPGVGAKRRKALLQHFGGLQQIKRAGVRDLAAVPGINQQLAQQIFDHLRG